ncbi:tetratricopeptide repeat protein [Ulvibacter antarcticus]|uniref:Tetratricopeptide repeat protein n=1 Tax=Ulvibacter antarcticus TaxID=442714 RepID=A0A3L9Z1Y7_9FLAO|nr:tetratricopeptide repeat protein [Ulvibacter antarcticus]RMA64305.1 hypothetical protein BXY75_1178 [Ulvibacter antarcticus]
MIQLETDNRKAFEDLNEAISNIDSYNKSKQIKHLNTALEYVDSSLKNDNNYLRAIEWNIIIHDLLGLHKNIVIEYKDILKEIPESLQQKTLYNLGAAYFHHYDLKSIDKAIWHFEKALSLNQNIGLDILSKASLGRSYALRILLGHKHLGGNDTEEELKTFFDKSVQFSKESIKMVKSSKDYNDIKNEVIWTAYSALGAARMYLHDNERYIADLNTKNFKNYNRILCKSYRDFTRAEKYKPKKWANWSNMGSALWRRALLYKTYGKKKTANQLFEKSIETFNFLIKNIRLNYDFALYEMGKVYRMKEDTIQAKKYFKLARKYTAIQNNVPIKKIEEEEEMIENKQFGFLA